MKKLLTLQIVRNNVHIRIAAALLALWYCVSIIGFGVHTCRESGRSFIVTFMQGYTCKDIHPEHNCDADLYCSAAKHSASKCGCGHDHNHEKSCGDNDELMFKMPSCCTNDYQVLTLTGGGQDEVDREHRVSNVQLIVLDYVVSEADIHSIALNSGLRAHSLPISQLYARDVQLSCNIWRI